MCKLDGCLPVARREDDEPFPVLIDIKHLTRGFKSPVSEHQTFDASPSTSSTGLFAPRPPSANVRSPILTGSKNVVAADVARAAWHIVARIFGSSGRL